jgi:hypothetical protein
MFREKFISTVLKELAGRSYCPPSGLVEISHASNFWQQ